MTEDIFTLIERRESLLDAWREKQRQIAALQAETAALLGRRWALMEDEIAAAPRHRDVIQRSMIAEYSAAGHVSKGSMEFAFTDAWMLRSDFALTRESFQAGLITSAHVREIVRESDAVREAVDTGTADADTLALYELAVLEVAERDTPARTKAHARTVAAALAGITITERHTRAREERTVTMRSVGDGLALLQVVLPEYLAVAIYDRLTRMARHQKRHPEDREQAPSPSATEEAGIDSDTDADTDTEADTDAFIDSDEDTIFGTETFSTDPFPADTRTMDQLRADLFTDLLLTSDSSAVHGTGLDNIQATIQVTVSATTLIGENDQPAELDGHGPLHPDIARALAGARTGWTRLFLNPHGFVTETDTYTPTEPMRRYLRARDQHCRFPGCRQPVHRCEIDHNHDYAKGGRTEVGNLSHFCLAHHALKHPAIPDAHRWTARQLPDQSITWTSPNGRDYSDPAPRRVMFVPSDQAGAESAGSPPPDSPPPRRFTFDATPVAAATAGSPF